MAAMIRITPSLAIAEDELTFTFVRASGPGGQHVNTTSSAVELRFDARRSPNLPADMQGRLERLAGARMTQDGVVILRAESRRSQVMNRAEVVERLVALLAEAAVRPRIRRPTRPTLASKTRRLDAKDRRSGVKSMRRSPDRRDDS